uniref:Putative serine carboxypeptidase lysosomal cathepsin a n=1 Tax=Amblyomma triste TaxID=251400 RepID=A0A023GND4_AMBTT
MIDKQQNPAQDTHVSSSSEGEPLFLTPLIEECQYEKARNESTVNYFKQFGIKADAHSGYITVNKTTNSSLFFLLIEAEVNASSAPLMLWTQGGPGLSALFGLFLQNGPLGFNATLGLERRLLTIQNHVNILYLDAPVGAGFSFTDDPSGYPKRLEDVTRDMIEFLAQFLKVFEKYQNREFYAAGDSYAARYSVALAHELLTSTHEDVPLKFEGVIGGVGFLAPIFYLANSSDFLFQASMLNETGRSEFKKRFQHMEYVAFSQGNFSYAVQMLLFTIFAYPPEYPKTLFQELTLYNDHASPLHTERPFVMKYCVGFVNSTSFKTAIHAGANAVIEYANENLIYTFGGDWLIDIRVKIEYVLENIRVLFYTGQLDALFPSSNLLPYFETLNWTHAQAYQKAKRLPWLPYEKYYGAAGFTKSAGNFTSAMILGMSHYAGFDKPTEAYYLMLQFFNRSIAFSSE